MNRERGKDDSHPSKRMSGDTQGGRQKMTYILVRAFQQTHRERGRKEFTF
jgi:hypothetical protein